MNQATLKMVVDVEKFFGLTDWSTDRPPMIGWWKTRLKANPERFQPQRRWWNGVHWSNWCMPDMSAEGAECAMETPTFLPNEAIEWCGLRHPHPDFTPSDRTLLHSLKRR